MTSRWTQTERTRRRRNVGTWPLWPGRLDGLYIVTFPFANWALVGLFILSPFRHTTSGTLSLCYFRLQQTLTSGYLWPLSFGVSSFYYFRLQHSPYFPHYYLDLTHLIHVNRVFVIKIFSGIRWHNFVMWNTSFVGRILTKHQLCVSSAVLDKLVFFIHMYKFSNYVQVV